MTWKGIGYLMIFAGGMFFFQTMIAVTAFSYFALVALKIQPTTLGTYLYLISGWSFALFIAWVGIKDIQEKEEQ